MISAFNMAQRIHFVFYWTVWKAVRKSDVKISDILLSCPFIYLMYFLQLITEQASFILPRSAEIEGKCANTESEIRITWKNKAYNLRIFFTKVAKRTRENDVTNKLVSHRDDLGNISHNFPPYWTVQHEHFSDIFTEKFVLGPFDLPAVGGEWAPVTPLCGCVLQEFRDKGSEVWKMSKVQFIYDTSETSHFINAYNRECPNWFMVLD